MSEPLEPSDLVARIRATAQGRIEATSHLPPNTTVNISLAAGQLIELCKRVGSGANPEVQRRASEYFTGAIAGNLAQVVHVSARDMLALCDAAT